VRIVFGGGFCVSGAGFSVFAAADLVWLQKSETTAAVWGCILKLLTVTSAFMSPITQSRFCPPAADTSQSRCCNSGPSPRAATRVGLTSIFLEQPIRLTSLCRVVTSALTHVRRPQTGCY